ncbi:MAG TPA: peroxide stress protein YaaA [Alcanivoracaceae bacterium]|nr:peroxide stress protein YaaA [Alcanivoracaceae bacterium]
MFMVLSPAKSLDYTSDYPKLPVSEPRMLQQSQELIDVLAAFTPAEVGSLMKISDKLADLNAARFSAWQQPMQEPEAKPAIYAFTGDVYTGIDVHNLTSQTVEYLQEKLRILSGLYGLLKPLDLIMPYRLEMGTRLENKHGKNLYEFWGSSITELLQKDMAEQGSRTLLNLASQEYFKAVKVKELDASVITPVFHDEKNGVYKVISFHAKKARGAMAAWVAENKVKDAKALQGFDWAGYQYHAESSTPAKPVFRRAEQ